MTNPLWNFVGPLFGPMVLVDCAAIRMPRDTRPTRAARRPGGRPHRSRWILRKAGIPRLDKVVEAWHAMNTWVRDIIPMAGGAYRQLINEFYKENRLMEGKLLLRGERVDLGRLRANVLNVIAEADHITPPCQSEGVMSKIGSQDKEVFRVKGGHIGIMAGSGAEKTTWPHIEQWLAARAD